MSRWVEFAVACSLKNQKVGSKVYNDVYFLICKFVVVIIPWPDQEPSRPLQDSHYSTGPSLPHLHPTAGIQNVNPTSKQLILEIFAQSIW
jgi:hypothetical protein